MKTAHALFLAMLIVAPAQARPLSDSGSTAAASCSAYGPYVNGHTTGDTICPAVTTKILTDSNGDVYQYLTPGVETVTITYPGGGGGATAGNAAATKLCSSGSRTFPSYYWINNNNSGGNFWHANIVYETTAQSATGCDYITNNFTVTTPVTSASYNPSNGLVTVNFASNPAQYPGSPITVSGATGTGSVSSLNGTHTLANGTSGTTLYYTISSGLTMTVSSVNVTFGYYTMWSAATYAGPKSTLNFAAMPSGIPYWINLDAYGPGIAITHDNETLNIASGWLYEYSGCAISAGSICVNGANNTTINMTGATIKNPNTNLGAAIKVYNKSANTTINGGTIENCGGAQGILMSWGSGLSTINGGTIDNCGGTQGPAHGIYIGLGGCPLCGTIGGAGPTIDPALAEAVSNETVIDTQGGGWAYKFDDACLPGQCHDTNLRAICASAATCGMGGTMDFQCGGNHLIDHMITENYSATGIGNAMSWYFAKAFEGGNGCPWNPLTSISWSSANGGQIRVTTATAHGLNVGDKFVVTLVGSGKYNSQYTATSGTAGSTIVAAAASDPGDAITSISWSGGVVTAVLVSAHNLNVGDSFSIYGVSPSGYNGTYTAAATPSGNTVTYALASNPGAETTLGSEATIGPAPNPGVTFPAQEAPVPATNFITFDKWVVIADGKYNIAGNGYSSGGFSGAMILCGAAYQGNDCNANSATGTNGENWQHIGGCVRNTQIVENWRDGSNNPGPIAPGPGVYTDGSCTTTATSTNTVYASRAAACGVVANWPSDGNNCAFPYLPQQIADNETHESQVASARAAGRCGEGTEDNPIRLCEPAEDQRLGSNDNWMPQPRREAGLRGGLPRLDQP